MTKDEMIKGLRYKAANIKAHMEPEFFAEVADYLEEQKWIPVSEKLPKAECGESDSVLVCFEDERQAVLYFDGGNWCYPTGEPYISVNHKNGWHNKVVAWMPLPEPYAESEGTDADSN